MLLMSLACDAIALGSNQVEVEVQDSNYWHRVVGFRATVYYRFSDIAINSVNPSFI